jgi:hypothetical protein
MLALNNVALSGGRSCQLRGQAVARLHNSSSSRVPAVAVYAAKKGGAKKGAQKKGGSALADLLKKKEEAANAPVAVAGEELASPEQYADPDVVLQLMMITQAYKKQYNE